MSQFSDGDIVVQTKIKDKPNENIFQNENVQIMDYYFSQFDVSTDLTVQTRATKLPLLCH